MKQPGIFAKTFRRTSVMEVLTAVSTHGFTQIQFNMACAGLPSMPTAISARAIEEIREAIRINKLDVAGLSATYNMCHPDPKVRAEGLRKLRLLASHAKAMGTSLLSLCTGTRHPTDKWAFHPQNHSKAAWRDMRAEMEKALLIAEQYDLQLGIEPELANIVSDAPKARLLLEEMSTHGLRIILDPANLFEKADASLIKKRIDEALELLAPFIVMTHAKDRNAAGDVVAPGRGIIPFDYFLQQLRKAGIEAPMIAHGFGEEDAGFVFDFLNALMGNLS